MKNWLRKTICILLAGIMTIGLSACAGVTGSDDIKEVVSAEYNLMDDVVAEKVEGKEIDDAFTSAQFQLAMQLFQKTTATSIDKNTLISPLSIQLALAMTANGADGDTKTEMEAALAGGGKLEDLNKYLYTYINQLPSAKDYRVNIANSIWFREGKEHISVEQTFLQTNANYYNASIYEMPFNEETKNKINEWVKENTYDMIDSIIDNIDPDTMMYLINAVAFDAKWQEAYEKYAVYEGDFHTLEGATQSAELMSSEESIYVENENVTGFIKPYKDNKYSFVALLPRESGQAAFESCIQELTGEGLQKLLTNTKKGLIAATLPKFSYEYEIGMNDILKELGMEKAFDSGQADFSKLGQSSDGNLSIGSVLHKTYIEVDESGTKAAAVTKVEVDVESETAYDYIVCLDRPFIYMIIDNETNLPIFVGTFVDAKTE